MDSAFRNPLLEAEPFQASQGHEEPSSPKDLQEFYDDMEKRDVERRKSRGKTRRWSRKGSKDGPLTDKPSVQPPAQQRGYGESTHHEWEQLEKDAAKNPSSERDDLAHEADDERASFMTDTRHGSIIPPRWSYQPPDDKPVFIAPPSQYRLSYKIHNPVGPRFYRNHHLRTLNSSAYTAAHHPPSAFSTSFPPLAALPASSPVLGLGHAHLHPHNRPPQFPSPATSGSSSESVPTPESSQSIFQGPGHEVLRKKNKNASGTVVADPVDLMDGSNPWGQKFHHDSPYDLGKKGKGKEEGSRNATWGGSTSLPGEPTGSRSRSSTLAAPRKTTPSPLSQSTSAVHIPSDGENVPTISRKLSKNRRTSGGLKGLFGNSKAASRESVAALPAMNGVAHQSESHLSTLHPSSSSKPTQLTNESNASIASASGRSPEKDGKRTSVLGRMAKRFSFARKTESMIQMGGKRGMFDRTKGKGSVVSFTSETEKDIWGHSKQADSETGLDPSGQQKRQQEERKNPGISKRVPPPSIDTEESATSLSPPAKDPPPSTQPTVPLSGPQSATSPSAAHLLAPISVGGPGLGVLDPKEREDPHVRDSLMSLDPHPWKLGNLTIANPDLAGSETDLSVPGDVDKRSVSIGARMSPIIHAAPQLPAIAVNGDARVANGSPVVGPHKESALPPLPSTPASAVATVGGSEPSLPPTPRAASPDLSRHRAAELLAAQADIPLFHPPPLPKDETPPPRVDPPPKAEPSPRKKEPPPPKADPPPLRVEVPSKAEAPVETSSRSNRPSYSRTHAATSSSTSPSHHLREYAEHEYHIDVPIEGSLFTRTAHGGGSAPPVEKPILPPLPAKREPSAGSAPRLRTNSKDTTIFTSIFATPSRSRKASDSSPDKSSSHGHNVVASSSVSVSHRSRGHLRTGSYSPEKPAPSVVYVRAGSESPDKEGRRERTKDKDYDRERRRERRASERENEREPEDRTRRRERERRESSVRRREKEDSDRERERRKEERAREREERERARERERERDRERGRRREREREEREREKAKEREGREREKAKEREERERLERERSREKREQEKAREREKMKAMEREKERARESEREREKERERERRKEKESRQERETEKYRLVSRGRTSSFPASGSHNYMRSDDTDDADDLVKLSAMGRDWEIVESSRTRKQDRDDRHREKARENGYATTSAAPQRGSNGVRKESSQPNGSAKQLDTTFSSASSRSGLRQRAHSLEIHSRSSSSRPPTPPQKEESQSRRHGDKRSSVPSAQVWSSSSRPDARTSTAYVAQRPTSGFPSSSDVAMFKAKEAWEHDRMWRGQSMAFSSEAAGGGSAASTSAPVVAGAWGPMSLHDAPVHAQSYAAVNSSSYYHQPPPANHGSSYTSFMVQPAWSHPQYAQPPPPPPPPIQPYSFEASENPLPPPPRESTFDTRTPPRTSLVRPTSAEVVDGLRAH